MIVGIVGTSYCGSTCLELLLGTQPDFQCVGEASYTLRKSADWCYCVFCGEECPIYSPEIREICTRQPHLLYSMLAKASLPKNFVVSDKHPLILHVYGGIDIAILLYKSPPAFCYSYHGHENIDFADGAMEWLRFHDEALRYLKWLKVPTVVVPYFRICEETDAEIKRLCSLLNTQWDSMTIKKWNSPEGLHRIGGNSGTLYSVMPGEKQEHLWKLDSWYQGDNAGKLRLDTRSESIPKADLSRIIAISGIEKMEAYLEELSYRDKLEVF